MVQLEWRHYMAPQQKVINDAVSAGRMFLGTNGLALEWKVKLGVKDNFIV